MTIAQDCDSKKIKENVSFQTRLRLGEEGKAQSVPLQIVTQVPPHLQNVDLKLEEDRGEGGPGGARAPKNQPTVVKYVSKTPCLMVFNLRINTCTMQLLQFEVIHPNQCIIYSNRDLFCPNNI